MDSVSILMEYCRGFPCLPNSFFPKLLHQKMSHTLDCRKIDLNRQVTSTKHNSYFSIIYIVLCSASRKLFFPTIIPNHPPQTIGIPINPSISNHFHLNIAISNEIVLLALVFLCFSLCASEMITLTSENFYEEIYSSGRKGNWIIMFTAPWTSIKKKYVPVFTDLAKEIGSEVNVATISATDNPVTASEFGISNYPTIIFIVGKKYAVYHGSIHLNALKELVSETYKYLDYKSIPKAPSPFIAYVDRVVNFLERQLSTSPLLICGIFVFVGIVCGVFLVLIGELVLQPVEAPSPIKEDFPVC
ncbi:uncharacterized protein [Blastocystis hominis]|uniref:Thioredoxin domain-containing protein n=1 Tax=Blastocystis hominis TaxID=12968 RepID=D8M2Q9_BLAHO|nr:uncharacterized protein [Blastocystis hominis]CBK22632.2 unnamed protein product [Blastocystis hominis]|eukprot:XP_012896680.1 uncharacterized protein [Blastocystis hominis]